MFRPVHHPYSDRPPEPVNVRCYPIKEILAEKTRALVERCTPRDLYDIIRLYRFERLEVDVESLRELVARKSAHRNLRMPNMEAVNASPRRVELDSEWANMLGHQLPTLPPIEAYTEELANYFAWLEGKPVPELPTVPEVADSDLRWQPPGYISLPREWGTSTPVEAIRFAGVNRLRIQLNYIPEKGAVGVREVEPYSFRMSKDGNLLLYARNIQRPRISAYRIDRIRDVIVTTHPFTPIWRVEF